MSAWFRYFNQGGDGYIRIMRLYINSHRMSWPTVMTPTIQVGYEKREGLLVRIMFFYSDTRITFVYNSKRAKSNTSAKPVREFQCIKCNGPVNTTEDTLAMSPLDIEIRCVACRKTHGEPR